MNNQILKNFFLSTSPKGKNLKRLYRHILRQGPISVEKIIEKTQIKPATCARLLEELVQNNLITANQFGQSTGGRRPSLYRINPTIGYLIGIEITGIFSTILLMNIELSIIDKIKLKTSYKHITYQLLDMIIDNINTLLHNNQLNADDILGIGLATDDLLTSSPALEPSMANDIKQLTDYIKQHIPIYLTVGSPTNFAAIAEHRLHYADKSKRFLFTRCDIEIHSSTIIDSTIPLTDAKMTHAFGHMSIDINGLQCVCGLSGCLQQYSALPAIKSKIIQKIAQGQPSTITKWINSIEELDYHLIFKALEHNDQLTVAVLEEAAYHYSMGLFNLILAFQPDTVICGGTLVPKSSFFTVIQQNIAKKLANYPQLKTKIYPASASYDIVSQGAGGMVLEQFLQ